MAHLNTTVRQMIKMSQQKYEQNISAKKKTVLRTRTSTQYRLLKQAVQLWLPNWQCCSCGNCVTTWHNQVEWAGAGPM